MTEATFGALARAFNLLHTPLALEVLADLAAGRSPYDRIDDDAVIGRAIDCLRSLDVVTSSPRPLRHAADILEITAQGRRLFERLVGIERMAANLHLDHLDIDQVAA